MRTRNTRETFRKSIFTTVYDLKQFYHSVLCSRQTIFKSAYYIINLIMFDVLNVFMLEMCSSISIYFSSEMSLEKYFYEGIVQIKRENPFFILFIT